MKRSKKLETSQRKLTDFWVQKPAAADVVVAPLSAARYEVLPSSTVAQVKLDDDDSRASSTSSNRAESKGVKRKSSFFGKQWDDGAKRTCPSYKRVPGSPYVVDAFNYGTIPGITGYFLSHFHSDHYIGLRKAFTHRIYCSAVTANLIKLKIGVSAASITVLSLNQPHGLPDGTLVTLYDANHCPGSVLFLFESMSGTFLHTGDLRAEDSLIDQLKNLPKLNILYLDTTYMNGRYVFPSQKTVIDEVCRFVKSELDKNPKTLVVCGTYMIGKERIVLAISEMLGAKIAVEKQKMNVLKCLDDENIFNRLTLDYSSTNLFVVSGSSSTKQLQEMLSKHRRFRRVLSVWPSGWEYRKGGSILSIKTDCDVTTVGAPYSEHSSYAELEKLVRTLRPARIIPTVNFGQNEHMQTVFADWLARSNITGYFK